jgi:hypothetical protein
VSDLALQGIRAAIERHGTAEVSAERLAALAGAPALDDNGWQEIDRWLSDHDLIVICRPSEGCEPKAAQASLMFAP